jgi:hypothetical protein
VTDCAVGLAEDVIVVSASAETNNAASLARSMLESIAWPEIQSIQMLIPQVTPIQPINVILQQPPGPPLWLTIVLSALTGAVSAILGGVVIEYAKPEIIKWSSKRTIKRHVNEEFTLNLSVIEAALRVMRYAEGRPFPYRSEALLAVGEMLRRFRQDRYERYFATDKDMLYELDVSNA